MAERIIHDGDLLPFGDMTSKQMWMAHDLAGDINTEVENKTITVIEAIEVLERLASVLRQKQYGRVA